MRNRLTFAACLVAAGCLVLAIALPAPAAVDMYDGTWHFTFAPYVWLPTANATFALPGVPGAGAGGGAAPPGNVTVQVGPNQYLTHLNFAFPGYFELRKGDWSIFADIIDANLTNQGASVISLDRGPVNASLNVGTTASFQMLVGTLAPSRTLIHTDTTTLDAFIGVGYLGATVTANWNLTGPIGAFPQSGTFGLSRDFWDGVGGVKGQVRLQPNSRWFVPYYIDFGAGSFTTWQALAGIGYAFSWGDVILSYRHMYIDMGQGGLLQSTTLSGPMLGVAFHW